MMIKNIIPVLTFFFLVQTGDGPAFKFSDNKLDVGAEMIRRNISFSDNCWTKLKTGMKTLDSLAAFMKKHPDIKIEVAVHQGEPVLISSPCSQTEESAKAIKSYLENKGIDKGRISAKGYGMTMPLVPQTDPKAKKLNKRVVFRIAYNKY